MTNFNDLKVGDVLEWNGREYPVFSVIDQAVCYEDERGQLVWMAKDRLRVANFFIKPRPEPLTKYPTTGDPLAQVIWEALGFEKDYASCNSAVKAHYERIATAVRKYFEKGGR